MNLRSISSPARGKRFELRKGFALVVALILMVLLSILALGMLSLSSVSLRQSSVSSATATARANARMALMLAIGELQQQLGPDKRVNIGASQLSNDNGKTTSAAIGRRQWTGVFDSWNSADAANRPTPRFRKWLVSGDGADLSDVAAAESGSADDVTLWEGIESDGSDRVSVPMVDVRGAGGGDVTGGYAWWIGDENSKALIGRLPNDLNTLDLAWSNAQSAPVAAYQLNESLAEIDRASSDITRLASHRTVDLLGSNPSAAEETFHDFTTRSMGVVCDVARGGLKRDLSLFLDHPVSKPLAVKLPNEKAIYPKGLTWEELWLFHNVWRALEPPVPGLASMTGGNLAGTQILMTKPGEGAASVAAFRSDPFSIYKVPNFIRSQWLLSLWSMENTTTTPSTYQLFWVTDGIITLWNPLDVPIALHPEAYMSFKYWHIPYTIRISDATGVVAESSFFNAARVGNNHPFTMIFGTAENPHWGRYGTSDPVVLMPGEVLVMSEGPGNGDPILYSNEDAAMSLGMRAGWNLGRGRRLPVTLKTGKTVTPGSNLRFDAFANNDLAATGIVNQHFSYGADSRGNKPSAAFIEGVGGRQVVPPGTRATSHTDMFPPVSGTLPSIATMVGSGKHPFMLFSHQVKTEDSATSWSRMFNPRFTRSRFNKLDAFEQAILSHEIQVDGLSGSEDSKMPQFSPTNINRGLFGGSYWDLSRGQDTVITMSVPREAPVSLGAFQHALANGLTNRSGGGALKGDTEVLSRFSAPEISRAISNSYALPVIDPAATENTLNSPVANMLYQDHSYHTNRMLWDSWFLSGIVQRQSPHHTVKRTANQVYADFLQDPTKRLPNSRMVSTADDSAAALDALFVSGGNAKASAYELSSSKLMVEGAFNVNSTSIEAWKAVLGSLDEAFIPVADSANDPSSVSVRQSEEVPVASNLTSFGAGSAGVNTAAFDGTDVTSAGNQAQWRGFRQLDHSEVGELAEALVEEIRNRGPFLSMSDFINRRVGNDKDMALRGPLQAALDRTVNSDHFSATGRLGESPAAAGFAFPEAARLPKSVNTPAHVLQADVLTAIGSQLAARSDTFRIRAYGEARDPSGKVIAQAWCEAMLQRVPDYLDPLDTPEAADPSGADTMPRTVPALKSTMNRELGRRLKITSFQWLSSAESQS